jgi:RNA polymerase sigma factor (sigma-70 family)
MPASAIRLLRVIADDGQTDAALLGRFIDCRDEIAFSMLVRRHAPMVWGVCRRVLPTDQDAEDAFQATFLVLVEKVRAVPREAVGNWLYGVARRAALLSRRTIVRRRERTGEMGECPAPEPSPVAALQAALDEELSRLPDAYRTVIVLCDLEGRTRREAAAILGWPEGTVAGRLVRARAMLAKRMARLAPSASIAVVLAGTASARVPEVLPPAGPVPPAVTALTRELKRAMVRGKLMKTAAVVLLLAGAGFGMILQAGPNQDPKGSPVPPGPPEVKLNPPAKEHVAWGDEVNGLQAGLVLKDTHAYRQGETVKLEVRLRNVGKAEVKITSVAPGEHPPTVTDAQGVRMTVAMPPIPLYYVPATERVLKPGDTITLYHPVIEVQSTDLLRLEGLLRVDTPTTYVAPGKYKVAFGGMVQSHPTLTTGRVEITVQEPAPREAAIAWGKEVGGLQAGLELRGGEKRAYRHGETVTLVLRVRNVGKETVKFEYVKQYLDENPPTVTGADGKTIPQGKTDVTGVVHAPVEVSLEPGKEMVLESRIHGADGQQYELRPAGGGGTATTRDHPLFVGTGKVVLQYERVFGNSSIGRINLDPALSKLATGKLALDVEPAAGK